MKHQLNLDYTIAVGDLAPYFDALEKAKPWRANALLAGLLPFLRVRNAAFVQGVVLNGKCLKERRASCFALIAVTPVLHW